MKEGNRRILYFLNDLCFFLLNTDKGSQWRRQENVAYFGKITMQKIFLFYFSLYNVQYLNLIQGVSQRAYVVYMM